MNAGNENLNVSQLMYAHLIEKDGEEFFVNIYPEKIMLDMFVGDEPVVVEVRKAKDWEESKYWAWFLNFSIQPYKFIWPSIEKVRSCVPNYKEREAKKEGKIVNVMVERWHKI